MATETQSSARQYALSLLARRAYGVGELTERLIQKEYPPESADEAAAWLVSLDYLNDEAYARDLAQAYADKGYGYYRIRGVLLERQLPAELSEKVLEELPPSGETLDGLIARMAIGIELDDSKQRRQLAAALSRRGFLWDDIAAALSRYYDE